MKKNGLENINIKNVVSQVKLIVSDFVGRDARNVNMRHFLQGDLGLDSLDVMELSADIEHKLRVYLPDDLKKVSTVKSLIQECINYYCRKNLRHEFD